VVESRRVSYHHFLSSTSYLPVMRNHGSPQNRQFVVPPQGHIADNHIPNLGTMASVLPAAPPSNGTGSGGGIGSGSGGGVGAGHGAGVGPGSGGGIGGGVFKVGGVISAPQPVSTPDPEYFQPAMKDGKPVNVQISVEVGFRLY
jgi:hypothetical protein